LSPSLERRLLQLAIAVGCLVPLLAGGAGVLRGPEMLKDVGIGSPADLESHYRYLSGLLLGLGLGLAWCVPRIEARTGVFRMLGLIAVIGGLARLLGIALEGIPSGAHLVALGMEIGVVPLLLLWQARVARHYAG
jgi:hypothetical protein